MSAIHAATASGLVNLLAPDPATITPAAMACALAKINRWAGNTMLPINVAQHSVLVRELFLRLNPTARHAGIYALLHDGHEYLVGDFYEPAAQLLAARIPDFEKIVAVEKDRLDQAIRTAWSIPEPSLEIRALVHEADMMAADVEWLSVIHEANGNRSLPPRGVPRRIRPLPWDRSEDLFRETLEGELAARSWEASA